MLQNCCTATTTRNRETNMATRNTISDVAKAAGVSIKTVSRVLNKERYVRAATREKVEAAMAAMAFSPSIAARDRKSVV